MLVVLLAGAGVLIWRNLPEDAPLGAVALLSYKYNDRKIGQVYLISASAAEAAANGETAPDDGNTASDPAASNTGASGKPKQAKSSFHLTLPKTSESIGENGADCGRQCASGSGVCGACMVVLPASSGRKDARRSGENGEDSVCRRSAVRGKSLKTA